MIKCQHLFENRIYLISCKSVENIKIFKRNSEKRKIKGAIDKYLNEICNLLQIKICESELHLIIQLKNRESLEAFFKEKHKDKIKEDFFIPKSTYIFGRQMSNMLVSFVKSFNMKHKRNGVLIDGRYRRHLIETERELQQVSTYLKTGSIKITGGTVLCKGNAGQDLVNKYMGVNQGNSSNDEDPGFFESYEFNGVQINLRGCFITPFKLSLRNPFLTQKIKNFRINNPCGPNYN